MRNFVVTALAAITLSGAFTAPAAMAETVTVTVRVSHADLDLSTDAGKKTLESRVAVAIKAACAKPDTRSFKSAQNYKNCMDSVTAAASEQMERTIQIASL